MAQAVISFIIHSGLQAGAGSQWAISIFDLKPRLKSLINTAQLSLVQTRSGSQIPVVCACGDRDGASYYACQHNRTAANDFPILITFDADIADVTIDGRDFMYPVFQGAVPSKARETARKLFGDAVLPYLDRAWNTPDQQHRIALCDLAVQDNDVVQAHGANTLLIGGRFRTLFRSAFMVRLPVPGARIVDVSACDCTKVPTTPDVIFDDLR